jgi:hypothetical protein
MVRPANRHPMFVERVTRAVAKSRVLTMSEARPLSLITFRYRIERIVPSSLREVDERAGTKPQNAAAEPKPTSEKQRGPLCVAAT